MVNNVCLIFIGSFISEELAFWVNFPFNILREPIDRVHRIRIKKIGIEDIDEDCHVMGVSIQQHIIMRFTRQRALTQVYRERKKSKSFKFKVNKTKSKLIIR